MRRQEHDGPHRNGEALRRIAGRDEPIHEERPPHRQRHDGRQRRCNAWVTGKRGEHERCATDDGHGGIQIEEIVEPHHRPEQDRHRDRREVPHAVHLRDESRPQPSMQSQHGKCQGEQNAAKREDVVDQRPQERLLLDDHHLAQDVVEARRGGPARIAQPPGPDEQDQRRETGSRPRREQDAPQRPDPRRRTACFARRPRGHSRRREHRPVVARAPPPGLMPSLPRWTVARRLARDASA